ncbi:MULTISPECIES: DUF1707 and FHA domain-containing protein [unclassified Streptomyces]|uniref:DUF1707 and FHA domain-containing protein n=1 Tax=Streptomyces johnsoniae TaxID=3075532 RepID=A0ABU2SE20_9ACTN|nr:MULTISPECIES: DUF1707 and FHA domain-containing protein [unclassified Streptomyces]MDT0447193.1 DUF1707 and FHA domain-containing protein [Streptomyces sp. DSM 41886]ONK10649.1 Transcriptional regulatory protein EmbR [Streptomyces sp. MP131-18]
MTFVEHSAFPPRISDADRERALDVLRESMVEGRVSQDTFLRRVELIMAARLPTDLSAVLRDLPDRAPAAAPRTGWVADSFTRLVTFPGRMRLAWESRRLPELVLPARGRGPLLIGRVPGSGLRLNDASVSRQHAVLTGAGQGWLLRDLGSANGTWVNGRRVADSAPVGPGDHVRFGAVAFRLAALTEGPYGA